MTPLDLQFYNLSVMVLAGVCLGLSFDTYRVARRFWRPGWVGTTVGDLIFGLVCGVLLATALMIGNSGELRLYVFLGILAGYALYQALGGDLYRGWLSALFRLTASGVRAVNRAVRRLLALLAGLILLILRPFFWLADLLARVLGFFGRPLEHAVSRAGGRLKSVPGGLRRLWIGFRKKRE